MYANVQLTSCTELLNNKPLVICVGFYAMSITVIAFNFLISKFSLVLDIRLVSCGHDRDGKFSN